MKKRLDKIAKDSVPNRLESIKSTQTYQAFMAERYKRTTKGFPFKKVALAFSFSFILVMALLMGPFFNDAAHSELYLEINPSFVLRLNDNDEVEQYSALNSDGERLIDKTGPLEGKDFETAVNTIFDGLIELDYFNEEDAVLLYDVVSENSDLEQRHIEIIESLLENIKNDRQLNFHASRGMGGAPTENERSIMNDHNLGLMHARIIGNILSESDDYTFEELSKLSMPELMQLMDQFPPRQNHGPHRHPFDDNGTPPINPPRGR